MFFSFLLDISESTPYFPVVLVCIYYIYFLRHQAETEKPHTRTNPAYIFYLQNEDGKNTSFCKIYKYLIESFNEFSSSVYFIYIEHRYCDKIKKIPRENRKSPQQKETFHIKYEATMLYRRREFSFGRRQNHLF